MSNHSPELIAPTWEYETDIQPRERIAQKYDVAPGWLLVEEARGLVYGLGTEASVHDDLLIFSNKRVKDDLLEVARG